MMENKIVLISLISFVAFLFVESLHSIFIPFIKREFIVKWWGWSYSSFSYIKWSVKNLYVDDFFEWSIYIGPIEIRKKIVKEKKN